MQEAIKSGFAKTLAVVEITHQQLGEQHVKVYCLVKSRIVNLPDGYWYHPTTIEDPKSVKLTIGNSFGEVTWLNSIDVTRIDFVNSLVINRSSVELYENVEEPPVGEDLNQTFIVTFYESDMAANLRTLQKRGMKTEDIIEKFKTQVGKCGMELLDFDLSKGSCTLKVVPEAKNRSK